MAILHLLNQVFLSLLITLVFNSRNWRFQKVLACRKELVEYDCRQRESSLKAGGPHSGMTPLQSPLPSPHLTPAPSLMAVEVASCQIERRWDNILCSVIVHAWAFIGTIKWGDFQKKENISQALTLSSSFLQLHWASKETYHFFRARLTKIHTIKINNIWTQVNFNTP